MDTSTVEQVVPERAAGERASSCDVAIIGAGPYGLAAAAHLRAIDGLDVRIFGEPMSFWEGMPRGMLLRSTWEACHIGFPDGELTLDAYRDASGRSFAKPVPLDEFVRYGHWFQQIAVPDVDRRRVIEVSPGEGEFDLRLDDQETIRAGRVVVAAGIETFAQRPALFDQFAGELVSHSSAHRDLGRFAGQDVLVVGGGQSALESAALLHEAGASVEVIARCQQLTWLRGGTIHRRLGRFKPVFYAQTDVGPLGLSRLVAVPRLFNKLPRRLQEPLAYRAIRPAGARWLVDRLKAVPLTTQRRVVGAATADGRVQLTLDDGSVRVADHVILATGYRVDVGAYDFLSPALVSQVKRVDGYPILNTGMESSVPRLHFLGAPAAWSFGPINRFVSGSWYGANALARSVRRAERRRAF